MSIAKIETEKKKGRPFGKKTFPQTTQKAHIHHSPSKHNTRTSMLQKETEVMKSAKPPLSHNSSSNGSEAKHQSNHYLMEAKDELINVLTEQLQPRLISRIEQYKKVNRILRMRLNKAKFIYKRIARETEVFPSCFFSDDEMQLSEDDCNHKIKPSLTDAKLNDKK